jgi:hypothetical protein
MGKDAFSSFVVGVGVGVGIGMLLGPQIQRRNAGLSANESQ